MRRIPAFLALLGLFCGCQAPPKPEPPSPFTEVPSRLRAPLEPQEIPVQGPLEVHVIDVGQGDAILVQCPDGAHQLLIDAGELEQRCAGSQDLFVSYLTRRLPEQEPLEVVINSHPRSEHLGSMPWLLANHPVDYYVDNGRRSAQPPYPATQKALSAHQPPHYLNVSAAAPGVLDVDFCPRPDVSARVLRAAEFGQSEWEDDNSIVVRVDYGQTSFLFPGDAEELAEGQLLADPALRPLLDCDVLKVAAHGGRESCGPEFLAAVSPQAAAISCAPPRFMLNAHQGCPRKITLERLEEHVAPRPSGPREVGACDDMDEELWEERGFAILGPPGKWVAHELTGAIYLTAADGDLVFKSDGERILLPDETAGEERE